MQAYFSRRIQWSWNSRASRSMCFVPWHSDEWSGPCWNLIASLALLQTQIPGRVPTNPIDFEFSVSCRQGFCTLSALLTSCESFMEVAHLKWLRSLLAFYNWSKTDNQAQTHRMLRDIHFLQLLRKHIMLLDSLFFIYRYRAESLFCPDSQG